MNKIIFILLLVFSGFCSVGQKLLMEEMNQRFTELGYVEYYKSEHLIGNWFMTSWEATYDCWGDQCNRIQYGLVNEKGDTIPPFFTRIRVLQDSLLFFESDEWATLTNVDLTIISPFENIFPLGNSDFAVKKDGYWGIADNDMQEKTGIKYDSLKPLKGFMLMDDEDLFLEHEVLFMPAKYHGKWGLIEVEKDSAVIPFDFDYLDFYSRGIYVVKEGKHGMLTIRNHVLVPLEYDSIAFGMVKKGSLWSLNKEPFDFKYSAFTAPSIYKCRCLKSSEGWIMIDGAGKQITNEVYEDILNFQKDIMPLKLKGKWGFIDCLEGKTATPFIYDSVEKHFGYSAEVKVNGEIKIISF